MLEFFKQIKTALILLAFFTVLTGFIYPYIVTFIAEKFFPVAANGSVIMKNEQPIGSTLIGQYFSEPQYFWGRPSATTPFPYNAANSSGSNLGPTNPALLSAIKNRIENLQKNNGASQVPIDLVTTSASGLDPDISVAAAYYQVARIAKARKMSKEKIDLLIQHNIEKRTFGILGEPRVNVLRINLALDSVS